MNKFKQITNLIFEAAVTKRLKRTGWQLLGEGDETVGEHSFMTAVIAYFLAKECGADVEKVLTMSVFHDFHESRTGDVDKISLTYITRDQAKANRDIFSAVDRELLALLDTYEEKKTIEARVVYEANIIAFLVDLKLLVEKGSVHAREWLEGNVKRLRLPEAIDLANNLVTTDSQDWWKVIRAKLQKEYQGK